MNRPRSSRRRYQAFVEDYKQRRLDEKTDAKDRLRAGTAAAGGNEAADSAAADGKSATGNARGPLIVDACLRMGYTTITIGVLGFLGLGLPPPDPDWGGMIKDSYGMVSIYPHMPLIPCVAISSLVLGFNMLADGLREISLRD